MPSGGVETPIPASVFARLTAATRYVITGAGPESWFGPQQPLAPQAPPEVKGRQWDYPFGVNLNYVPRSDNLLSFGELRTLADALPLLRTVIETRKDQIAALNWTIRPRISGGVGAASRCGALRAFLAMPDRRHDFSTWLRMLVEDMLVIDAATIYPRYARSGAVYSLDVIDGATIKPLIGEDGRSPELARSRLSAGAAWRARGRFRRRRAALSAAQPALASALRLSPGRADRADDQHRAAARAGDARLLQHRLDPRFLRHAAEGLDRRSDTGSSRIISTR